MLEKKIPYVVILKILQSLILKPETPEAGLHTNESYPSQNPPCEKGRKTYIYHATEMMEYHGEKFFRDPQQLLDVNKPLPLCQRKVCL